MERGIMFTIHLKTPKPLGKPDNHYEVVKETWNEVDYYIRTLPTTERLIKITTRCRK